MSCGVLLLILVIMMLRIHPRLGVSDFSGSSDWCPCFRWEHAPMNIRSSVAYLFSAVQLPDCALGILDPP